MARRMDLTEQEIVEATAFMTTATHTPSGNIVSTHRYGNTKVIIRDTYMDDKNIRGLEAVLESFYPNVKITITRQPDV